MTWKKRLWKRGGSRWGGGWEKIRATGFAREESGPKDLMLWRPSHISEEGEADRLCGTDENLVEGRGCPGDPVVKTSTSSAGGIGSIPGKEAKIPHASRPTNWNVKQMQSCTRFNKDFKMVHGKKKKRILVRGHRSTPRSLEGVEWLSGPRFSHLLWGVGIHDLQCPSQLWHSTPLCRVRDAGGSREQLD